MPDTPATERPLVDYDSPTSISTLLDAEGFAMRKRYGQNFLVNAGSRAKVLAAAEFRAGMTAWEIGPGMGAMTKAILDAGVRLTAFEIDEGFVAILERLFGAHPAFALCPGDFLKTWRVVRDESGVPDRIFGNLPYNVAAAIVAAVIEGGATPELMVFTVQKEAARRMAAGPGTKDYSSFSVLCSSVCEVRVLFDLGAGNFWPQPRVTSSVVAMRRRNDRAPEAGTKEFSRFTRSLFATRRKTIRNNLKGAFADDVIRSACSSVGIDPEARAETLTVDRILSLYRAMK